MKRTVELYADDEGTGDSLPVVFLHSLAGSTSQWSAQLKHLRKERRAVALEWHGHGDYSFPAVTADVNEAIERLGLGRFVLVGHSGGGLVALQYAAEHPERVAGLLLLDPAGDSRQVPSEQMELLIVGLDLDAYAETIEGYWRLLLTGSVPEVQERVMADLRATPKETVVGLFQAQLRYDPLPALRLYRGPALSVITPMNNAPSGLHNLDAALPHITFTGAGHWL